MKSAFILAISLTLSIISFGSEVIDYNKELRTLKVTQKRPRWKSDDQLCVIRNQARIACGQVNELDGPQAIARIGFLKAKTIQQDGPQSVQLIFSHEYPAQGDHVILTESGEPKSLRPSDDPATRAYQNESLIEDSLARSYFYHSRRPASIDELSMTPNGSTSAQAIRSNPTPLSSVNLGINFVFPTIQYQQMFSRHSATGLMPIYLSAPAGDGGVSAWGLFAAYHYYSWRPFEGFWIQAAVGFYSLTATLNQISDQTYSPAVMSTLGWRWRWNNGVNFGFGAGVQKLIVSAPSTINLQFSGLFPSIVMDMGIAF